MKLPKIGPQRLIDLFEAACGLFYPNVCQICNSHTASCAEGYVCTSCKIKPLAIMPIKPPFCDRCGLPFEGDISQVFECSNCRQRELSFDLARSAVTMTGLVLEVIHQYKYNRKLWFEPFLEGILKEYAVPHIQRKDWDLIVPIPLHAVKKRHREFNQSERLGRRLSQLTEIPLAKDLVKRVQPTRTQTKLSREERDRNVRKAFALKKEVSLKGQRIIVFDDVLTTGATCNACARILKKAGAEKVGVWTLARGV